MKWTGMAAALIAMTLSQGSGLAQSPTEEDALYGGAPASGDERLLQTQTLLGEPRPYCVDVPGFGRPGEGVAGWQITWPLGAHSCKVGITKPSYALVDQLISAKALRDGQIAFSRFGLCAESAANGRAGNAIRQDGLILLAPCSDSPRQKFTMNGQGEIRPDLDTAKCLTIGLEALEAGNRTPTEPWYQRGLVLSTCSPAKADRQRWALGNPNAKGD